MSTCRWTYPGWIEKMPWPHFFWFQNASFRSETPSHEQRGEVEGVLVWRPIRRSEKSGPPTLARPLRGGPAIDGMRAGIPPEAHAACAVAIRLLCAGLTPRGRWVLVDVSRESRTHTHTHTHTLLRMSAQGKPARVPVPVHARLPARTFPAFVLWCSVPMSREDALTEQACCRERARTTWRLRRTLGGQRRPGAGSARAGSLPNLLPAPGLLLCLSSRCMCTRAHASTVAVVARARCVMTADRAVHACASRPGEQAL